MCSLRAHGGMRGSTKWFLTAGYLKAMTLDLQLRSASTTFAVVPQDYGGLARFISNLRSLQRPDFIRSSLNPTQVLASSLGER